MTLCSECHSHITGKFHVCFSFLSKATVQVYLHISNEKNEMIAAQLLVKQQHFCPFKKSFLNLESFSVSDLLKSLSEARTLCMCSSLWKSL